MAQSNMRRSIPVVDKAFQYKYTAIVMAIVIVVSAILGYLLLQSYWEMNRVMDLALESPEIADKVRRDDALKVFHVSIVFLIFEVLALAVMGLIITHRVCGPIFVIHRHLVTLRDGKYPSTRPLRQGDEFKETFKLFTEVLDLLKQRDRDEAVRLKELIVVMHEQGQPEALIASIKQLVAEREARAIEDTNS